MTLTQAQVFFPSLLRPGLFTINLGPLCMFGDCLSNGTLSHVMSCHVGPLLGEEPCDG